MAASLTPQGSLGCYEAMPKAAKAAIAYVGVSTQSQGRSGIGLGAQTDAIARFAEAEGFAVAETFTEVETGKGADALERRPKLAAAIKAARKAEGSGYRLQAGSPLPRRALHFRPYGAQGAFHRHRIGRRR